MSIAKDRHFVIILKTCFIQTKSNLSHWQWFNHRRYFYCRIAQERLTVALPNCKKNTTNVSLEKYGAHFERWFFQKIQKYFEMASCCAQQGIHIMSHSHNSWVMSDASSDWIHYEVEKNGEMLMKNISMRKRTKFEQKSVFKIFKILLLIQLYEVLLWLVKSIIQSKVSYSWIMYRAVDELGSIKWHSETKMRKNETLMSQKWISSSGRMKISFVSNFGFDSGFNFSLKIF